MLSIPTQLIGIFISYWFLTKEKMRFYLLNYYKMMGFYLLNYYKMIGLHLLNFYKMMRFCLLDYYSIVYRYSVWDSLEEFWDSSLLHQKSTKNHKLCDHHCHEDLRPAVSSSITFTFSSGNLSTVLI